MVVVALVAVAVWRAPHGPSSPPAGPALNGRYTDPMFGWKIRYPRGWVLGHFEERGRTAVDAVRVANFAPDLRARSKENPLVGWLRPFPADGVAVQVWYVEGPVASPPFRDSAFPLSPASFGYVRYYLGGGKPRPLYRMFYGNGYMFTAGVWIGPRADSADRRAVWAIVRSLRFPALTEGTIYHGEYYVLGAAARYPVGSVTAFPAPSLPRGLGQRTGFYLIHAPRAFYVIAATYGPSVSSICSVAFDPKRRQFFCPGKRLRWNLSGRPVGGPAANGADRKLRLLTVTVARGHVFFEPFSGTMLAGNPWR
jgi:hypothetical protein